MAKTKSDATDKPRLDFNLIYQLGLKAQALADKYAVQIDTRLSAPFLTGFGTDLTDLITAIPAVITSKGGKIQLTAAQTTALASGYNLVKGVRTTVKGHHPAKDVLLAYGVGAKTNKLLVKDVSAALKQILDRIAAQPAEAQSFDLVAADVTALTAALASIVKADKSQEQARVTAPQTTAQRNATANRILAGVKKIAGAGMRSFVDDATVYASFEGLVTKKAG